MALLPCDQRAAAAMRAYMPDECAADGYPPEWHDLIKHAVRGAAGNRCVRCGHPYLRGEHASGEWSPCDDQCRHGGPVRYQLVGQEGWTEYDGPDETVVGRADLIQAQWRILTVHHLDGNKANCRWWNLAALCQRCHLQIQGKVVMDRRWLRPHSPWFQPYVAGYYAWRYLGVDLSLDEAVARLDELLALEHRQLALGEVGRG